MENKKKIFIISLILAIVILIILILVILFWPKKQVGPVDKGTETGIEFQSELNLPVSSPERVKEESSYPLGLKQLAMSFTERYGSYSSDADFKNLDDIMPMVTEKMAKEIEGKKEGTFENVNTEAQMFQGFTTKALSFSLDETSDTQASVTVGTQRLTYLGSGKDANVSYWKIKLKFIKIGAEWKIDDAQWLQ